MTTAKCMDALSFMSNPVYFRLRLVISCNKVLIENGSIIKQDKLKHITNQIKKNYELLILLALKIKAIT